MTDAQRKKQKKNYMRFRPYQFPGNSHQVLEIGQRGFLATCNNREKNCIRECYNVLKHYADELYGPEAGPKKSGNKKKKKGAANIEEANIKEEVEETDISDDLKKEIDAARAAGESKKERFQAVDTGTKNCVFIKTTLADPVELGVKLIKDIAEKKLKKSRFLLRLTPIAVVCKADIDEISKASGPMFDKYFLGEGKTFSVIYNKRYNKAMKRDVVIKVLADKVLTMNPKNKVDLNNPELSVIAEIIKGKCCLSVVEGYLKYRKYNLVELAKLTDERAENGGAKKEDENVSEKEDDNGDKDSVEKTDNIKVQPKEKIDSEKDATVKDPKPEDIVRDVPVGNKLKELLERKKTSEEEPDVKKFKDQPEEETNAENSDEEEEPNVKKFKDDPEEEADAEPSIKEKESKEDSEESVKAEKPENGEEPNAKKFKDEKKPDDE